MTASWKTVRVFISSTLRDMHAERDHLVKVVFPALRESLSKDRICPSPPKQKLGSKELSQATGVDHSTLCARVDIGSFSIEAQANQAGARLRRLNNPSNPRWILAPARVV